MTLIGRFDREDSLLVRQWVGQLLRQTQRDARMSNRCDRPLSHFEKLQRRASERLELDDYCRSLRRNALVAIHAADRFRSDQCGRGSTEARSLHTGGHMLRVVVLRGPFESLRILCGTTETRSVVRSIDDKVPTGPPTGSITRVRMPERPRIFCRKA